MDAEYLQKQSAEMDSVLTFPGHCNGSVDYEPEDAYL